MDGGPAGFIPVGSPFFVHDDLNQGAGMVRMAVGIVVLTGLLVCLGDRAGAQGEKASELRDTMKKIGDGSSGLFTKLGRELRDEEPSWDDARKMTKEIVRLSAGLTKYTPPLGDKPSLGEHANRFAEPVAAPDQ